MGKLKACMQRRRSRNAHPSENWVWLPKNPEWEKLYCYKIGGFKWKELLEAQKKIAWMMSSKIYEWDDSAAEEAFQRSKERFYIMYHRLPIDPVDIPSPDLYIDEIDWDIINDHEDDDEEIVKLLEGLGSAADEEDNIEDYSYSYNMPDYYHIRIEDIKPTGWDVDFDEETSKAPVLTGLIVGC